MCAQCPVEYYFKGECKLVTYPWHKGLKADPETQAKIQEILAQIESRGSAGGGGVPPGGSAAGTPAPGAGPSGGALALTGSDELAAAGEAGLARVGDTGLARTAGAGAQLSPEGQSVLRAMQVARDAVAPPVQAAYQVANAQKQSIVQGSRPAVQRIGKTDTAKPGAHLLILFNPSFAAVRGLTRPARGFRA